MTDIIYCDNCGKRIDHSNPFESRALNLCPECAARLYQKIFGDPEADEQ